MYMLHQYSLSFTGHLSKLASRTKLPGSVPVLLTPLLPLISLIFFNPSSLFLGNTSLLQFPFYKYKTNVIVPSRILSLLFGINCHHTLKMLQQPLTTFKCALEIHYFHLYQSD